MTREAQLIMDELQSVLIKRGAALFFTDNYEAELWVDGECHAHITHDDDCKLVAGSVCQPGVMNNAIISM
jgi:hypothetical protein